MFSLILMHAAIHALMQCCCGVAGSAAPLASLPCYLPGPCFSSPCAPTASWM
jgi:hypothetical protein